MKRKQHSDEHRVFDSPEQAQKYSKMHRKRGIALAKRYARLLSELGFCDGGKILDDGCGPGIYCIELAKAFPNSEIIGIDLSEPMLDIGRQSAEDASVSDRVRFEIANAESLPFQDSSFDAVVSVNMFHHIGNPLAMVNEVERMLKPDGILLLADIRRSWVGYFMHPFRSAFTIDEAKEELGKTGLRPWRFSSGFLWWGIEAGRKTR
jgi:ubiquinone/menaquinone biosynthesis C-methylase UbiE